MITGKLYNPTTQGKNERFHQTLFRYLDKQPIAATFDEHQQQVDRFDVIYNTQHPHQDLPGKITPQQFWEATPIAKPPRPQPRIEPPVGGGRTTTADMPAQNNKPVPANSFKISDVFCPKTAKGISHRGMKSARNAYQQGGRE